MFISRPLQALLFILGAHLPEGHTTTGGTTVGLSDIPETCHPLPASKEARESLEGLFERFPYLRGQVAVSGVSQQVIDAYEGCIEQAGDHEEHNACARRMLAYTTSCLDKLADEGRLPRVLPGEAILANNPWSELAYNQGGQKAWHVDVYGGDDRIAKSLNSLLTLNQKNVETAGTILGVSEADTTSNPCQPLKDVAKDEARCARTIYTKQGDMVSFLEDHVAVRHRDGIKWMKDRTFVAHKATDTIPKEGRKGSKKGNMKRNIFHAHNGVECTNTFSSCKLNEIINR